MTAKSPLPVTIRPARPADASAAAQLLCLSMGALADLLFGHEPDRARDEVLAELFVRVGGRFSHQCASLAEVEGQAAGLLIAYPANRIPGLDLATGKHILKMFGLTGVARFLGQLLPFGWVREAERDEYYISNLAVSPRFQGQGVGGSLLAHAEGIARAAGSRGCSLLVDLANHGAKRLYERTGYQVVFTRHYHAYGGGGCHRMVKRLPSTTDR